MELKPTTLDLSDFPTELLSYVEGANFYDSSCSDTAKTIFIDRPNHNGYFLKIAHKATLEKEAIMTDYFHSKCLSAKVCSYISKDRDYLVTEKINGQDGIAAKHLNNPKKLCETFAESLFLLHSVDYGDCPIKNRTSSMLNEVEQLSPSFSRFDSSLLEYVGLSDKMAGYRTLMDKKDILVDDVLLHGDYCLPNILLDDFKLSGFIDVGYGGVGDRHFDLFWGIWTLQFNLHTDVYRDRFLDCYGRSLIDFERLKLCGIISALT